MSEKQNIPQAVRDYFATIGRINGNKLKEKYGSDYFKRISAMRKNPGRKPASEKQEIVE
jgi:hypothetical protein